MQVLLPADQIQRRVGELASRLAADLSQIQDTLTGVVPHFLRQLDVALNAVPEGDRSGGEKDYGPNLGLEPGC